MGESPVGSLLSSSKSGSEGREELNLDASRLSMPCSEASAAHSFTSMGWVLRRCFGIGRQGPFLLEDVEDGIGDRHVIFDGL
jgi:hypothetical protein